MTILVLADDEQFLRHLPDVPADVLVSCGDLPDGAILFAAERCRCAHILAVKGNHDSTAPFKAPIIDLHLHTHTVRNIVFGGFCGAWQYKPEGNYLFEQWEVDEKRYEWSAPPDSVSDVYEPTGAQEGSHQGQAGTH